MGSSPTIGSQTKLPMNTPLKKEAEHITVDSTDIKLDNASQLTFMSRSRIRKSFQKQTRKSLFLFLSGTILLVAILLFFGIPLLINFTVLLDDNSQSQTQNANQLAYVPSPSLHAAYDATNSASIDIEGTSDKTYTITVYNNDKEVGSKDVGNNGKFKTTIKLAKGENNITAVATSPNNIKSDKSDPLPLLYLPDPPKLDLSYPSENQEFKGDQKFVEVTGSTSEGAKVTVNGFWAVMSGSGLFRYNHALKDGDNILSIVSTDQAGNSTEKTIIVKYSP